MEQLQPKAEYRLVQKQREHALFAWEEKIRVYEKALGIRIQQDDAGGPTIVRFSGVLPAASKGSAAPEEEKSFQEDGMNTGECFFAFRLDAHGAVSDAQCWPPVEIFEDVMEAFGRAEISLPIVVACMRRSFKEWRKLCDTPHSGPSMRRQPLLSGGIDTREGVHAFSSERHFSKAMASHRVTPPEGNRHADPCSHVAGNKHVPAFSGARVQNQQEGWTMKDVSDRTSLFVFGANNTEFETVQRRWQN
ncbi:conserved hypothetical protein [Neospora caninum Liverpool]|uniref:Uncharacterized protein n=1 Tax=Neospora caninum (strain Liverpool) TaxID=572307 RepID=F0VI94_NEOCL|nr:conserved hypothetical protein [Neospora caninum Liverpool]CBZ53455.1 conserved hypothetical protein [Neospora caninum Liverpool]|eukprot:XP_003883487.1 conserved hypothetical protein [Neospora caninum Liverpool]